MNESAETIIAELHKQNRQYQLRYKRLTEHFVKVEKSRDALKALAHLIGTERGELRAFVLRLRDPRTIAGLVDLILKTLPAGNRTSRSQLANCISDWVESAEFQSRTICSGDSKSNVLEKGRSRGA